MRILPFLAGCLLVAGSVASSEESLETAKQNFFFPVKQYAEITPDQESNTRFQGRMRKSLLNAFEQSLRKDPAVLHATMREPLDGLQLAQGQPTTTLATPAFGETDVDEVEVTFNWEAVPDAEEYVVNLYQGTDNSGTLVEGPVTIAGLSHVSSDLNPNEAYTLEIVAQASGFTNSESASAQAQTGKLSLQAPQASDFQTSVTTDTITISWTNEVPEYLQAYLTGVDPTARHGNFFYSFNLIFDGDVLRSDVYKMVPGDSPGDAVVVFEDLQPETNYEVQIESTVTKGIAAEPSTQFFTEGERLSTAETTQSLPQLDTPLFMEPDVSGVELTFRWEAVPDAEEYVLNLYQGSDTSGTLVEGSSTTTNTSYVSSGLNLNPDETYTLEIMVRANGFIDSASASAQAQTGKLSLQAPQASDFQTSVTTDTITISWTNEVPEYLQVYLTGTDQIARHGNFFYSFNLILDGDVLRSDVYKMVPGDSPGDAEIVFEDLQAETNYEVQIESTVTKGVAAEPSTQFFTKGERLSIPETTQSLPQLATPVFMETDINGVELTFRWGTVPDAEEYVVNLYEGTDTSGEPLVGPITTAETTYVADGLYPM